MSSTKKPKPLPKRSSKPLSSLPKRPPYKFLTRNLEITPRHEQVLQKICIKRLYLRKFIDVRDEHRGCKEIVYRSFKNNKLFKTLISVKIPCISQSYAHESLKYSKNRRKISIDLLTEDVRIDLIIRYLKKLPVTTHSINISFMKNGPIENQDFNRIAKSIRHLPKLQFFHRTFMLGTTRPRNHVQKEMRMYSQSALRLKNMNKIMYSMMMKIFLYIAFFKRKSDHFIALSFFQI